MTDEALYQQIRSGNTQAFDQLYDRYQRQLYQYILRYLNNEEVAQEVFHDAFLQVLKGRELDFSEGTFRGWLYLVARNNCLNQIRSRQRETLAKCNLLNQSEIEDPNSSVEQVLIKSESCQQIQIAIKKLPESLRDVLNLKLTGLDYKEISRILKVPVGTIKSRVYALVQFIKTETNL